MAVDGKPAKTADDFLDAIESHRPGEQAVRRSFAAGRKCRCRWCWRRGNRIMNLVLNSHRKWKPTRETFGADWRGPGRGLLRASGRPAVAEDQPSPDITAEEWVADILAGQIAIGAGSTMQMIVARASVQDAVKYSCQHDAVSGHRQNAHNGATRCAMERHGIGEILTCNGGDFKRFPGITVKSYGTNRRALKPDAGNS